MKLFKRFALVSVFLTYLLIFVGGLVRVSGAGLGCPDWPKCFGRWIPPLSIHQLPQNIDPASFNLTLAWIEYINRLLGMLVGLSILATAILAIIYFRKQKQILWPSLAAALLVAYQGWQGGQVVTSNLRPLLVSAHMVIAFIIVSLLLYVIQQLNSLELKEPLAKNTFGGLKTFVLILWIFTIIQVLLGTEVRASIEMLSDKFPLLMNSELLQRLGSVDEIHRTLGILLALVTIFVAFRIIKKEGGSSLSNLSWGMIFIVFIQAVLGSVQVIIGLPALMQLFHLWVASLLVGVLLLVYTSMKKGGQIRNV